jgi:molybdopterin converting factor subunit 1
MKVNVKMFALAAELAGGDSLDVELDEPATIGELRQAIAKTCPPLAAIVGHVMFAVDAEYATDAAQIGPNAQIACIPPVSGG